MFAGFSILLFYPIKTDHIYPKPPVILRQLLRKGKFYRYKKKISHYHDEEEYSLGNKLIKIHDINSWVLKMFDHRNDYEEYTIDFCRDTDTGVVTISSDYTGEKATLPGELKSLKLEVAFIKNVCQFTTKYLSMRHGTRWLNQDEALTFLQKQEALIFIPSILGNKFVYPAKTSGWVLTPEPAKIIENFTWGN